MERAPKKTGENRACGEEPQRRCSRLRPLRQWAWAEGGSTRISSRGKNHQEWGESQVEPPYFQEFNLQEPPHFLLWRSWVKLLMLLAEWDGSIHYDIHPEHCIFCKKRPKQLANPSLSNLPVPREGRGRKDTQDTLLKIRAQGLWLPPNPNTPEINKKQI